MENVSDPGRILLVNKPYEWTSFDVVKLELAIGRRRRHDDPVRLRDPLAIDEPGEAPQCAYEERDEDDAERRTRGRHRPLSGHCESPCRLP